MNQGQDVSVSLLKDCTSSAMGYRARESPALSGLLPNNRKVPSVWYLKPHGAQGGVTRARYVSSMWEPAGDRDGGQGKARQSRRRTGEERGNVLLS